MRYSLGALFISGIIRYFIGTKIQHTDIMLFLLKLFHIKVKDSAEDHMFQKYPIKTY